MSSVSKFKIIRDIMVVIIICKNEDDPNNSVVTSVDKIFPIITLGEPLAQVS